MRAMLALVALASVLVVPASPAAASAVAIASAGSVASGPRITFDITVGDSCWTGTAKPPGARIVTRVETPDGQPKGFSRAMVSAHGTYRGCLNSAQTIIGVMPGDVMIARLHGETVRWNVPGFAPLIDRDADTVSGNAVPGSRVHVSVRYGREDRRRPPTTEALTVLTDAQGHFVADFSGVFDIRASDTADVTATFAGGSMTQQLATLYLGLRRSGAHVNVMTTGLRPIRVELLAPGGVLRSRVEVDLVRAPLRDRRRFPRRQGSTHLPAPRRPGARARAGRRIAAHPRRDARRRPSHGHGQRQLHAARAVRAARRRPRQRQREEPLPPRHHGRRRHAPAPRSHVAADIRRDDFMELTCAYPSGDTYSLDTEVR